jgi:ribosomal-protein-alanine N-acetyltransferase
LLPRVKIRAFEPRDLRRILKIENGSFGRDAWPGELFREYAREYPELFLIALVGRSIAGYSIACLARGMAEIASIAVLPRYRERGAATTLLQATLRKVRRAGAQSIWLMVRSDNRAAIALYRKFGFVRTSTVSKYYEDGSAGRLMKLALKP